MQWLCCPYWFTRDAGADMLCVFPDLRRVASNSASPATKIAWIIVWKLYKITRAEALFAFCSTLLCEFKSQCFYYGKSKLVGLCRSTLWPRMFWSSVLTLAHLGLQLSVVTEWKFEKAYKNSIFNRWTASWTRGLVVWGSVSTPVLREFDPSP